MPPRNPARSLFSEEALAARIAHERERRGWTYESVAKRMTEAGCPINQSAIYKIEKAEPRRRITVDELVAFSQIFDMSVEDLLVPLDLAGSLDGAALEHVNDLMKEYGALSETINKAQEQLDDVHEQLVEAFAQSPAVAGTFRRSMKHRANKFWRPVLSGILAEADARSAARESAAEES